jgi:hypothetical protein
MKSILIPALIISIGILAFVVCAKGKNDNKKADPNVYFGLRNMVWETKPEQLNLDLKQENEPWAFVLDFGVGDGFASLIIIADGTISLYLSSGGGYIGCGQYESVLKIGNELLKSTTNYLQEFKKTEDFKLPTGNHSKFYIFTKSGKFCSKEFNPDALVQGTKLYSLFDKANEVITEIRKTQEKN